MIISVFGRAVAILKADEIGLIDQTPIGNGDGIEIIDNVSGLGLDVLALLHVSDSLKRTEVTRDLIDAVDQFKERDFALANDTHVATALFEDFAWERGHVRSSRNDDNCRVAGLDIPHHLEGDGRAVRRE